MNRMNDAELRRSVLWHRLISEVDLKECYGIKNCSYGEWIKYENDHWDETIGMRERLRHFSESNPESINEADDDIKDILAQTMPKFLKKYPQYKGEPCIASDD